MFCHKCGAELYGSMKFCPKCGASVAERVQVAQETAESKLPAADATTAAKAAAKPKDDPKGTKSAAAKTAPSTTAKPKPSTTSSGLLAFLQNPEQARRFFLAADVILAILVTFFPWVRMDLYVAGTEYALIPLAMAAGDIAGELQYFSQDAAQGFGIIGFVAFLLWLLCIVTIVLDVRADITTDKKARGLSGGMCAVCALICIFFASVANASIQDQLMTHYDVIGATAGCFITMIVGVAAGLARGFASVK